MPVDHRVVQRFSIVVKLIIYSNHLEYLFDDTQEFPDSFDQVCSKS